MRQMTIAVVLLLAAVAHSYAAPAQTFALQEYLGHTWTDELISLPLEAPLRGETGLRVSDETGAELPWQRAGERVYLLVTLPAGAEKTFTIAAGQSEAAPAHSARVIEEGGYLVLDSGTMAVRLPLGQRVYDPPAEPDQVPGPLQGVRLPGGDWIGRSWLEPLAQVNGYTTTVTGQGPLFAEATVEYRFEGDRHYRFTVRVIAGQATARISESMDLNPGGYYALLSYDNDADASSWEWWNFADYAHITTPTQEYPRANAIFSFYEGLEPNQSRWAGGRVSHPRFGRDAEGSTAIQTECGELLAPLTYEQDERFNRIAGWWLNSFSNYSYSFTAYNDRRPETPAVSFATGRPSHNVNPTLIPPPEPWIRMVTGLNDLRIWTRQSGDLQVIAPISLGSREWLLTVQPQASLPGPGELTAPTHPYRAVMEYSFYPLEKVKDWSFDWPEPENAWPRLFCPAGDMDTMKERVAGASGGLLQSHLLPAIYRPGGTAEAMVAQVLLQLEQKVRGALAGTGEHGSMNWFHASLHMMSLMPLWEAAMATPGLNPETRARIKAYGAFIAHRAWDEDYWPPKETANGWGSANMGVLAAAARVMTASAMAGHPRSERWLARSPGYLDGNLQGVFAEDGSGMSCPHYLGASIDPIMYMALALKFGGGYDVFSRDPRWPRFAQFAMDILTPPDPRSPVDGPWQGLPMTSPVDLQAQHRRNLWPLGHTSRTEPSGLLGMLALGLAGVDDKLAGALRALDAEQGYAASGGFVAYALLQNTTSPLTEPDLRTRWYPHYGAILRDGRPEETWFAIRYSKFAFDHFQADMGAFTMFAQGVPLMMDFGSMYSPENHQAVYHNRVAWNVQEGEPRPCPGNQQEGCFYQGKTYFEHQFEPWTCQAEAPADGSDILSHYGEITSFAALPGADYLQGEVDVDALETQGYFPDTPTALTPDPNQARTVGPTAPFSWIRRVLFVKQGESELPGYFLVRDDFTAPCPPPTVSYWVMADNLTFEGNRAYATGQFGVDLELYAVEPQPAQFSQWAWEHQNWGGERQLCVRIARPEGGPFLTLLYPRRANQPRPQFTRLADGAGVRIASGGQTDYVFLSHEPVRFRDGDLGFEGVAGYLRTTPGGAIAVLTEPGTIEVEGVRLAGERALEARFAGGKVAVSTNGPAQTLRLAGRLPEQPVIQVDDRRIQAERREGAYLIAVPAGAAEVTVE